MEVKHATKTRNENEASKHQANEYRVRGGPGRMGKSMETENRGMGVVSSSSRTSVLYPAGMGFDDFQPSYPKKIFRNVTKAYEDIQDMERTKGKFNLKG